MSADGAKLSNKLNLSGKWTETDILSAPYLRLLFSRVSCNNPKEAKRSGCSFRNRPNYQ